MRGDFDYFVIFGEMRTGSNLIESTLSTAPGISCHSEAFNPVHIGGPNIEEILGITMAERQRDPMELLDRIRNAEGLNGFRFFHDHEPRVLDAILADPRCAKIVLTRNPVDSFISLRIANATKRWKMTNVKHRTTWQPVFQFEEFESFLAERQAFQLRLLSALQVSGQTAFYLDYEDSLRVNVINGLLRFLGVDAEVARISNKLVRQNPEDMEQKVRNFPEMEAALQRIDWANLSRTPNFEPRRGPGTPQAVAAAGAPLLYVPIRPRRDEDLRAWLSQLGSGGLVDGFNNMTLRAWKRDRPGHRSFTVLRHPLARANEAFSEVLTSDTYTDIRTALRKRHDVPFPPEDEIEGLGDTAYRAAFLAFLRFVTVNLNGQTSIRQDVLWASQWSVIQGFAQFATPDLLCREDHLVEDLAYLVRSVGLHDAPTPPAAGPELALVPLARIYDAELEKAARDAYGRDYVSYGFGNWSSGA
ncbi:sulfotransferase domain-containing protein [Defluviimonas sp. WL0024]|uniref:Sulfotransferase domain-containing protein n=1 Tax=Albidovulum salinarum TaxID=2984153 RepID=A0ABT2X2H8_9RHOB|nr:sulfotransferase domain-containing protein [Defluviimonas sp. WL0024]MCU9848162.1 sulfotransferase domain-containing protein [Defluviimonas sp. WL0024]